MTSLVWKYERKTVRDIVVTVGMTDLWRLLFTLKQRLQYWLKPAHQPPYLSSFNDFQFIIDVCYVGMHSGIVLIACSWGRRCEPGQGSDNYFVQNKPDTAGHRNNTEHFLRNGWPWIVTRTHSSEPSLHSFPFMLYLNPCWKWAHQFAYMYFIQNVIKT